jgi:hypothetical protein
LQLFLQKPSCPRKAQLAPCQKNPKPGNPPFSAHSINTSPTLTSRSPDFAGVIALLLPGRHCQRINPPYHAPEQPTSITIDPRTNQEMHAGIKAIKDFITDPQQQPRPTAETGACREAWRTLQGEQRLLSCQTAWLSARAHSTPIQLSPRPTQLNHALHDLDAATNSRKIAALFQTGEAHLAAVLPEGLLEHLDQGELPVTFFSDLPFEWTMLGWGLYPLKN